MDKIRRCESCTEILTEENTCSESVNYCDDCYREVCESSMEDD